MIRSSPTGEKQNEKKKTPQNYIRRHVFDLMWSCIKTSLTSMRMSLYAGFLSRNSSQQLET